MSDATESADEAKVKTKKKKAKKPKERKSVTHHTAVIGGETIAYTATAGTLFLRDDAGDPRAEMFFVAYTRDDVDATERPLTFAFNGGPGSSSVWLQLGTFGPKRADIPDAAPPSNAPHRLVENAESILDVTDLVFIDPVGTGYSRALGEAKAKDFHGVEEDVASVGEFISRYLSRHGRWNSPRYLAGESYGTTRAAGLASHLAQEGLTLNGLVLVSAALMFQTLIFERGNDLPHVLYLPAYAAAAAYHGVVKCDDAQAMRREAERFAVEQYAPALLQGAALSEDRRDAIAARLAELTGLSASLWRRHDLRISLPTFCRELLRGRDQIIGRMDARFTGFLADEGDDPNEEDPSLWYPYGPYTALINDYLRSELGFKEERRYEVISLTVNETWTWADNKRFGYIDRARDLRRAMVMNPGMRVFFGSGVYDLATPYFASMHTARHLGREPRIQDQVTEAFYDAGHMMYLHEPSRKKLREDLLAFYAK